MIFKKKKDFISYLNENKDQVYQLLSGEFYENVLGKVDYQFISDHMEEDVRKTYTNISVWGNNQYSSSIILENRLKETNNFYKVREMVLKPFDDFFNNIIVQYEDSKKELKLNFEGDVNISLEYSESKFIKTEQTTRNIILNINRILIRSFHKEFKLIERWKAKIKPAIESGMLSTDEIEQIMMKGGETEENKKIVKLLIKNKEYWN